MECGVLLFKRSNVALSEACIMDELASDRLTFILLSIENPFQYRAALARLRVLEGAPANTPLAAERRQLELAVSRYLAMGELVKPSQRSVD